MQGKSQSERKLTEINNPGFEYSSEEAGCYYLGPNLKKYVRNLIAQYLARKKGTDDYYMIKMLIIRNSKDNMYERGAFHTEFTILSHLRGHPGVIQLHDYFTDSVIIEKQGEECECEEAKRVFMVFECLIPHGGCNEEMVHLHKYLSEKKKLGECEALLIFCNILLVINDLHKKNIVHKDLKLSNIILDRRTLKIKLINFYYAKLLSTDKERSYVQRGNPSYMAPETILGRPVPPKPCDMRSAGVILYAMLHGYLPWVGGSRSSSSATSSRSVSNIYSKIIANDYVISDNLNMSEGTHLLIRGLLCKDPRSRLKSSEALEFVRTIVTVQSSFSQGVYSGSQCCNQVVPECEVCVEEEKTALIKKMTRECGDQEIEEEEDVG